MVKTEKRINKSAVYTTIENFKSDKRKVLSYKELPNKYAEWVETKTIDLIKSSTLQENKIKNILVKKGIKVLQQSFFLIDGKGFFLDLFLPDFNVAIEIDGKIHKKTEDNDFYRDALFQRIGIITVRLTNSQVMRKNIIEVLRDAFYKIEQGTFSIVDYYNIPKSYKFDNKMTTHQKMIVKATEYAKSLPNKSSFLIKTKNGYICTVLNPRFKKYIKGYVNYDLIENFYKVVEDKGLKHDILNPIKKDRQRYRLDKGDVLKSDNVLDL